MCLLWVGIRAVLFSCTTTGLNGDLKRPESHCPVCFRLTASEAAPPQMSTSWADGMDLQRSSDLTDHHSGGTRSRARATMNTMPMSGQHQTRSSQSTRVPEHATPRISLP